MAKLENNCLKAINLKQIRRSLQDCGVSVFLSPDSPKRKNLVGFCKKFALIKIQNWGK